MQSPAVPLKVLSSKGEAMIIHQPKSIEEAVKLRHDIENSSYLAGGTEVLRLGSSIDPDAELIDITKLVDRSIFEKDGKVYIGGGATLQAIKASCIVPGFIRDAAAFCSSFEKRNSATVGGNVALKREDSYMLSSLVAAEADVVIQCHSGEKVKPLSTYIEKNCKGIIKYVVIPASRKGWSKKISLTSSSHAILIASESEGNYALSVSGSAFAYGKDENLYKAMEFRSDLRGSAEYKKYLASVVFEERR